jgi:hypothetical protein
MSYPLNEAARRQTVTTKIKNLARIDLEIAGGRGTRRFSLTETISRTDRTRGRRQPRNSKAWTRKMLTRGIKPSKTPRDLVSEVNRTNATAPPPHRNAEPVLQHCVFRLPDRREKKTLPRRKNRSQAWCIDSVALRLDFLIRPSHGSSLPLSPLDLVSYCTRHLAAPCFGDRS